MGERDLLLIRLSVGAVATPGTEEITGLSLLSDSQEELVERDDADEGEYKFVRMWSWLDVCGAAGKAAESRT